MIVNMSPQELRISADYLELMNLRELALEIGDEFDSIRVMCDVFEFLITDRGFEWVNAEDTGDLTDAPILGILGAEGPDAVGPFGRLDIGSIDGTPLYVPILWRWGFMDYAITSPQRRLMEHGEVIFISGVTDNDPEMEELYGQLMRPDYAAPTGA